METEKTKKTTIFKGEEPLELDIPIAFKSNLEVVQFIRESLNLNDETELLTYGEWQKRGFQVRKGEKAFLKVPLWKPFEKKKDDDKDIKNRFFVKMSGLFLPDQVDLKN